MMMLSWMRDLPITLYPGAPPLIQIRGKPATDQPLNRGISQQMDNPAVYAKISDPCRLSKDPEFKDLEGLIEGAIRSAGWQWGSFRL
jgi:hypothetical protein